MVIYAFVFFYLGLCLGLSSTWASNVQLGSDTTHLYKNIRAALAVVTNKSTPHTLQFAPTAADDNDENNNSAAQGPSVVDISYFDRLTIKGSNAGITTISGGGASLFHSATDATFTLNGLMIKSFSAGSGGGNWLG